MNEITLRSLAGRDYPVTALGVRETHDGDVLLEAIIPGETWADVVGEQLFSFLPETLAVGMPEVLNADAPVSLLLRLREPIADGLAEDEQREGSGDEQLVATVVRRLVEDHPASATLRQTEAWLLCRALQRVPVPGDDDAVAEIGLRTIWQPSL